MWGEVTAVEQHTTAERVLVSQVGDGVLLTMAVRGDDGHVHFLVVCLHNSHVVHDAVPDLCGGEICLRWFVR